MAAPTTNKTARAPAPAFPHLTIYRWPVTMMTSITHRLTGSAMTVGALVLAWWLISVSNGPEGYDSFHAVMDTVPGMIVIFGLAWSLAYHFFSGLRHLAWDMGYGFEKKLAERNSVIVFALSFLTTAAIFAIYFTGHAGYLQ